MRSRDRFRRRDMTGRVAKPVGEDRPALPLVTPPRPIANTVERWEAVRRRQAVKVEGAHPGQLSTGWGGAADGAQVDVVEAQGWKRRRHGFPEVVKRKRVPEIDESGRRIKDRVAQHSFLPPASGYPPGPCGDRCGLSRDDSRGDEAGSNAGRWSEDRERLSEAGSRVGAGAGVDDPVPRLDRMDVHWSRIVEATIERPGRHIDIAPIGYGEWN